MTDNSERISGEQRSPEDDRKKAELATRYALFQKFALNDQRSFYVRTVERYEAAAKDVNRIRALLALLTGFCSALATVFASLYFTNNKVCSTEDLSNFCSTLHFVVQTAIVFSVALPALGAFFNMLSDLYQWDRLTPLYEEADRALVSADALSPLPDQDLVDYLANYLAYANRTLDVMQDETTQWGLSITEPKGIEDYKKEAAELAKNIPEAGTESESQEGDTQTDG